MQRGVRFGGWSGDRRSRYWTVKTGATRSDVYVVREDFGDVAHISLHAGEWHVAFHDRHADKQFPIAAPDGAGIQRAVLVSIRRSACRVSDPEPAGVDLLEVPDPPLCLSFAVALVASPATTPLADVATGARHVWPIPMDDESACVVRAWNHPLDPTHVAIGAPPERHADLRAQLSSDDPGAMLFFPLDAGGVWVIDGELRFGEE